VPVLAQAALEALGESGVADLLRLRPDLGRPRATSLRELAQRAVDPVSLSVALRAFDVPTLQVAEALAALGATSDRASLEDLLGIPTGDAGRAAREALDRALDTLRRYLFLQARTEPRLLPEIVRAWPEPLGFGPPAAQLLAAMPVTSLRHGLSALGVQTKKTLKADLVAVIASALGDAAVVRKVLDQAPPAVGERIRQAAFGRPLQRNYLVTPYSTTMYGRVNADKDPTLWAIAHLLAVETYEAVVLPAEVTRALRGPDWHVSFTHEEPPLLWTARPERTAPRDASAAAGHAVRTVTGLLETLARRPAQRLKTGAIGVRELRRLAKEQAVGVAEVRLALALAQTAELVAPALHGLIPTPDADTFLRRSPAQRAAELMSAWLEVAHLPMLDPDDAWHPQVRQRLLDVKHAVLAALAQHPQQAADPEGLRRWLEWRQPLVFTGRLSAFSSLASLGVEDEPWDDEHWDDEEDEDLEPDDVLAGDGQLLVDAVLAEAAWLGVVADGALTRVGSHLLADDIAGIEAALASDLGDVTTTAHLQADLTAVVMGHPAAELSATLDELARREARSVATTWRFGPASLREALDGGWTADQILDRLTQIADGPVPQPLAYLVHDVARRHGHLRGGAGTCYLRGDDEALLREVAADRRLAKLGLRLVGPGVLIGERPLDETLAELRKAGYAPVPEDRLGRRVLTRRTPSRSR
jgi:Helicase conserved C-terminal domain